MEIKNLSWNENVSNKNNHPLLPKCLRGLIVGKSGCSKTTLLLNLLRPGWLSIRTIRNCQFLIRVCFNQSIKFWKKVLKNNCQKRRQWEFLKTVMKYCENKFHQTSWLKSWQKIKRLAPKSQLSAIFTNRQTMFRTQKKSPQSIKNLMIFDDLLLQKQNKCEAYYARGRHSNCDCLYLSQNYFKLPRQTIQENANFFVCFLKTRKLLITFLTTTCLKTWQKNSSKNFAKRRGRSHPILLWLISPRQRTGKYRSGFDNFYTI